MAAEKIIVRHVHYIITLAWPSVMMATHQGVLRIESEDVHPTDIERLGEENAKFHHAVIEDARTQVGAPADAVVLFLKLSPVSIPAEFQTGSYWTPKEN